ncbi:MAG: transcription-repair coupling factor [Bacteroidetes bacterium]|nr:transcription-repair coupling factor [Bacteroidota bacterium]
MALAELVNRYAAHPRLNELGAGILLPQPEQIRLSGLQGSSPVFLLAALYQQADYSPFNHVVVLDSPESAAYFHNALESLTGALDLFYFPASYKSPRDFVRLSSSHVMLRTEALMRFSKAGNRKILITYSQALLEKVESPSKYADHVISIKTGDTFDVPGLLIQLDKHQFTRTDFVYEPGQFAIRGGILDIYSFGNDKPYRIELFGSEVDSIRIVDPETQLSERKILQVSIIPHVEALSSDAPQISLFDFLPANTLFWMEDEHTSTEQAKEWLLDLEAYLERAQPAQSDVEEEKGMVRLPSTKDLLTQEDLSAGLARFHRLGFGHASPVGDREITFTTRSQPSFNWQFELLLQDLKAHAAQGYSVYIASENPRQLERLQQIFDDLQAELVFEPLIASIHQGFIDSDLKILCYTDHQIFQRYHKYKVKQAYNKNKALTIRTLRDLQPGDYVTHIDHGVGVFSGLQKIDVNGRLQEAVRLIYKDSDILYVNINSLHKIAKFTGKEGTMPKINKLGSDAWSRLKEKTKTKVKEIAFDLITLYAKRKAMNGFMHAPDNYLQTELESSFMYEDTPDQSKATADVKKDMESASPMDRLICGDVGFGKTEVAIRAAFKTCVEGKQAAILVPTTILAFQHYKTFQERLKDFPVTVDYINRFKSSKEKKETLQRVKEGKIDIIIGTHGLLGKEVVFKDLGLLVVDEEQKFGVAHKEKIKTLRTAVDCLTLTATPIPRTLQFSLMGARDLSIINTPPPNRQPIQTEVQVFQEDAIRDAIYYETERGGQVFFIYNRIAGLGEMSQLIQALCPDLSIGFAHGQMEGHVLEERILDFIDRKYDVLVCTNIVESGVDIPNVNTILVNNAHQFGLSDLHQLRGRVGRSNRKAFCYLLAPPISTLPADSRKRLQTLEQHSDLGSGFQIAMRDLDIRGAGNLLGGEQSGFMAEIGFETYQKILEEAIRELKRSKFQELFREEITKQDDFVQDCTIDTDLEILLPDTYVENIAERLSLYQRLDECTDETELSVMEKELSDRFGPLPEPVIALLDTVRCRKLAVELGFEKMSLKDKTLRCFFINRPDSPYFESETFRHILAYLQIGTNRAQLKQTGRLFLLVVENIGGMADLHHFLSRLHVQVFSEHRSNAY